MSDTTQQAESATSNPLDLIDNTYLDDASAELGVALTFLDAADNFMDEIRHWVKPGGYDAKHYLFQEVLKAQTMVAEAQSRLREIDSKIHTVIDQTMAAAQASRTK